MSVANPRINYQITAQDKTAQTFAAVRRNMEGMERGFKTIGKVATFGFLGNEVKQLVGWLVEVNKEVPAVAASFRDATTAAHGIGRAIGDAGLNKGLIELNSNFIAVTEKGGALTDFIGREMQGVVNGLSSSLQELNQGVYSVSTAWSVMQANATEGGGFAASSKRWKDWWAGVQSYGVEQAEATNRATLRALDPMGSLGSIDGLIAKGQSKAKPKKTGTGYSGGGGRSQTVDPLDLDLGIGDAVAREFQEVAYWVEATETPLERFQKDMEKVATLHRNGGMTADTHSRAVFMLQKEYMSTVAAMNEMEAPVDHMADAFAEVAGVFKDELTDGLQAAIAGTRSFSGAFRDMLSNIAASLGNQVITKGINALMDGVLGALSPGGGGLHGGFDLRNFAGGFATGGTIPSGQFGLVGEKGPEFIRGPATITPMGQGGGVSIQVVNMGTPQAVAGSQEVGRADGGKDIILKMVDAVASEIVRPGSKSNTAVRQAMSGGMTKR